MNGKKSLWLTRRRGVLPSVDSDMIRVATFNARALLASNPSTRRRRLKYFRKLLDKCDVVMVQELHGHLARAEDAFRQFEREFYFMYSFMA